MQNHDVIVGVDVGKSFHWLHVCDEAGRTMWSRKVDQDERQLDEVFTALGAGGERVLVVVDQPKNIGALTLACASRAGCDVGYLPGLAMRRAAGMLPGNAKTDQRDAQVIALTARVMPEALRPAGVDPKRAEMDALTSFDHDCMTERTRQLNRLHALLAEVNPMFEAAVGDQIDSPFVLGLMEHFGGPWGMRTAGQAAVRRWASKQKRVPNDVLDKAITSAWAMGHQPGGALIHEQLAIPAAARRVAELAVTRKANQARINQMLDSHPTYQALLTMPGVGPATAAVLVTTVDIALFPDHDRLASYAGIAARTRQSGTSIKGETKTRSGNKALKNALYLSAFAAMSWDPAARAFYDKKRAAGKRHTTAVIALASKRLKIMYAIMRDNTPYRP